MANYRITAKSMIFMKSVISLANRRRVPFSILYYYRVFIGSAVVGSYASKLTSDCERSVAKSENENNIKLLLVLRTVDGGPTGVSDNTTTALYASIYDI